MPNEFTDRFSNLNDHLVNAAKIIGRSKHRQNVFEAIYRGKQQIKSQQEIQRATRLSSVRVLQYTGKLATNHIIEKVKVDGHFAFKKIDFFCDNKAAVLRLARDPKKREKIPTKVNPRGLNGTSVVAIKYPKKIFNVVPITIDDIDNFKNVRKIPHGQKHKPVKEEWFKKGIQKIIGEVGKFTDWGGEKNDLFSTKLRIKGKRLSCAFAFKGRGTTGVLTLKKLGKNGDQLPTLFKSDAQVFIVEYWGQVDQVVNELMHTLAVSRSAIHQHKIYYCVVDGDDTQRIIMAYAKSFT